jgi:hypothetical protein
VNWQGRLAGRPKEKLVDLAGQKQGESATEREIQHLKAKGLNLPRGPHSNLADDHILCKVSL